MRVAQEVKLVLLAYGGVSTSESCETRSIASLPDRCESESVGSVHVPTRRLHILTGPVWEWTPVNGGR